MAKDIPMLLSGAMVRAFIAGQKTQTRRLSNRHDAKPGDRIWFKEAFQKLTPTYTVFAASHPNPLLIKWKPSIFMPKAICRCWAEVVEVKGEQLNDISESDAYSEGIDLTGVPILRSAVKAYECLWDSINTKPGTRWHDNPPVFVFTLKKLTP